MVKLKRLYYYKIKHLFIGLSLPLITAVEIYRAIIGSVQQISELSLLNSPNIHYRTPIEAKWGP